LAVRSFWSTLFPSVERPVRGEVGHRQHAVHRAVAPE
jgi:hypothetical protein